MRHGDGRIASAFIDSTYRKGSFMVRKERCLIGFYGVFLCCSFFAPLLVGAHCAEPAASKTPEEILADPELTAGLSWFERNWEILQCREIYYTGSNCRQKIIPNNKSPLESQFDDRECRFRCMCGDHIIYRYEIIEILGQGAYGDVIKAFDYKLKRYVCD